MIRIAHHTHRIENIELAVRSGVPIAILIRRPQDAILSSMIYSGLPVDKAAERYCVFYSYVNGVSVPFEVLPFEWIVSDFNYVVHKLNRIISKKLPDSIDLDKREAQKRPVARGESSNLSDEDLVRRISIPSDKRDLIKAKLRHQVKDFLQSDNTAEDLYMAVVARA